MVLAPDAGRVLSGHTHPFAGLDVRTVLEARAAQRPDHPFVVWEPFEGEGASYSYAAFLDAARRFAAGLKARGVAQGESVLLHLDNCPEILIGWYGCALYGAVAVTTNTRSAGPEIAYFAENCGARIAVTQPSYATLVKESCPGLVELVVTDHNAGAAAPGPEGATPFVEFLGASSDCPDRPADPMAPVGVQYTSGTTSRPKGVVWTHANALWGAKVCAVQEGLTSQDVHLVHLPLFHTNAQSYSVLASLWAGGTAVIQPRFSASRFWDVSLKHGCTFTSMIPFCNKALAGLPVPDGHSYTRMGNGIANFPTDPLFGVTTIGWWGMTETITHGIVSDPGIDTPFMHIGRASLYYEIVVEDEDGNPVQPGGAGALKVGGVRGLSLFLEYLNNEEATRNAFDEQGLFITGDRVVVHEGGTIQFADRDKDMLKVGGENVAASEVEAVILEALPGAEVAVVAKPDEMLDEVPVAFVLPPVPVAPGSDEEAALIETVQAACRAGLADFKVPRAIVMVDELPRATLNKIAKAELRTRAAALG